MSDFPVTITQAGAQPTPPAELLEKLVTSVESKVPGYTANLPPALITDLASTAIGALALIDSAMVDLINSVTPYGANIPLLNQLGGIYGVPRGIGSNTSVSVIFMGSPGFVVPRGFIVSDGNYQYAVQNNSIIPASGQSGSVYCLAVAGGSWAVPEGTVTQIITSVPKGITLSVTNAIGGLPGLIAQTNEDYRTQVMNAGMFTVQGTPENLKSALERVHGVYPNLISYRQVALNKWAIIVGGGDPYEVALAIYESVPDISMLTADVVSATGYAPHSETITINGFPDFYDIPFIVPSSQTVTVILTWNTSGTNFVDPTIMATLSTPAIVEQINNIFVGQPINVYQLQALFSTSVSSIINVEQISLIRIRIAIDGVIVEPDVNTGLVTGDYYKYFTTNASHVTVQKYDGSN
ncbi:MAG: baseplate J/gp47 family protein [Serratia sp. (in: enterobacteria)]|uniref:baseplate J/gp47 family protein n=1 Tax=Serratia sp. (in: enterobacteria) TaxID=616 RepID=UPI003F3858BC